MSNFDLAKRQEQLAQATDKARRQLSQGWHDTMEELKRVGADLGIDWSEDDLNAKKVLDQLIQHNPDLKTLVRTIDSATFETRAKIKWNTKMALRYAQLEGQKQYRSTFQPKIHQAKDHFFQTTDQFSDRLEEVKAKLKKAS